jgi:exopolysaccharide biosynthesis WecB/TagA/CpsF family protein
MGAKPRAIALAGVELHAISEADCVRIILDKLENSVGGVVGMVDLDHLRRCQTDVVVAALAEEADLTLAAGMPLVWASRLLRTPLPERVAAADLISSLSAGAMARSRSIFLVGDQFTEQACQVLQQRYANLHIAGHISTNSKVTDQLEQIRLLRTIRAAQPDIVFVGLPSPQQENLISRLRFICPNTWWIAVGESFRFVAGGARRAPIWMQKNGIEWAHRLSREPAKLFNRYIVSGLPFAAKLLSKSALRGLSVRFNKPTATKPVFAEVPAISATKATEIAPVKVSDPVFEMAGRTSPLTNLKAVVLLGGVMRPSLLSQSINRSMMDLPVDQSTTLLGHWMKHTEELQQFCGLSALPVRLMIDRTCPDIASAGPFHLRLRVERDFGEYRGTGGILRDIAADYADDDLLLVANAGQIVPGKLTDIVRSLAEKGGDVSLVSHADGTLSGLMLIRREVLSLIPKSGFVDMKEQALERIAQDYDVRVLKLTNPSGYPVRSREEYLRALKVLHRPEGESLAETTSEDWRSSFNVIETGASVDPAARLFDSVVMSGARVEAGAVIVRSIVSGGGVVKKDQTVVDDFVTPSKEKP